MSSWVLIWVVNVVKRLLAFPFVSFMDLFIRASIYYVVIQASNKENKRNKVKAGKVKAENLGSHFIVRGC